MRTAAPFEQPHYNYFFGRRHHEGSLEWQADNKDLLALNDASHRIPVVMAMYMDRPAVLSKVKSLSTCKCREREACCDSDSIR